MSEGNAGDWHWRTSCAINRAIGGQRNQPLCARAWVNGWQCFVDAMAVAFRDPVHCESIFIRWQAMQPRTGERPRAGY